MNICAETISSRLSLESKLSCGIPNMDIVDDDVMQERHRTSRVKRVVGGVRSKPVRQKHTRCRLSVRACVLPASPTGDSSPPDSDSVAGCCGGERED